MPAGTAPAGIHRTPAKSDSPEAHPQVRTVRDLSHAVSNHCDV